MPCKEITLTFAQAQDVSLQLEGEDLNDGMPSLITVPRDTDAGPSEMLEIDDEAAKLFLTQVNASSRTQYSLLCSPCLPGSLRLGTIAANPFLARFFGSLAQGRGVDAYIRTHELSVEEVDQLIRIATIVETYSPAPSSTDLERFATPMRLAIAEQGLQDVGMAFENLHREDAQVYDFDDPTDRSVGVRRPRILDLACYIFSIVALNRYAQLLNKHFSAKEQRHLPAIIRQLPTIKQAVVDGRVKVSYAPRTLTRQGITASYDMEFNCMTFSELIFRKDFLATTKDGSGLPIEIVIHELAHAWQDAQRQSDMPKRRETEAHLVSRFFLVLHLGEAGALERHALTQSIEGKRLAPRVERLKQLMGISLSVKDFIALRDYETALIQQVRTMIRTVRSGKDASKPDLRAVAERYATFEAIDGDLFPLLGVVETFAQGLRATNFHRPIAVIPPPPANTQTPPHPLPRKTLQLPADEKEYGLLVRKSAAAIPRISNLSQDDWQFMIRNIVGYMTYMHLKTPGALDANAYFTKVFLPACGKRMTVLAPPLALGIDSVRHE